MNIDEYLNHILTYSDNVKNTIYNDMIQSNSHIIHLPYDLISDQFPIITRNDLIILYQKYHKRIIFQKNSILINAKNEHIYQTITCKINSLYIRKPFVKEYYVKCNHCNAQWTKENQIPITFPLYKQEFCKNHQCQIIKNDLEINPIFIDVIKMDLESKGIPINAYITNEFPNGFENIENIVKDAFKIQSDILVHGILKIDKIDSQYMYFMEIWDIEILSHSHKKAKIIPFIVNAIPNSEKEMVMSVFLQIYHFFKDIYILIHIILKNLIQILLYLVIMALKIMNLNLMWLIFINISIMNKSQNVI